MINCFNSGSCDSKASRKLPHQMYSTMSHTGSLKKPNRPPPPPPIESPGHSNNRSDYIKISECHTGLPDRPSKPLHSSHQKSRSLGSSYLYLDSNINTHSRTSSSSQTNQSSISYMEVDLAKTEALFKCKNKRNKSTCR